MSGRCLVGTVRSTCEPLPLLKVRVPVYSLLGARNPGYGIYLEL